MEAQELDFSGRFLIRLRDIPAGIKLVTAARAIRWFGWGFAETLMPVFILMFSRTLTEAGLINSICDILFLVSLPLVGLLADVISSKTLLVVGLVLYPFIGISYYLGGATGIVLFVILARAINGIAYCLDTVGTDTYIRRLTRTETIASAFGYVASWANFAWLVAAIIGAYLVRFVPIGMLLFLVTPFSLIALWPLLRAKRDTPSAPNMLSARKILGPLTTFMKEIATLQKGLRGVVVLMFVLDVASVAATFFIPIEAYRAGASLSAVAVLALVSTAPSLSEFWLAEFIDGSKDKRRWALLIALASLPALFIAASLGRSFAARILIALGIEVAAIFGGLALQSYATVLSRRERYGEISSVLEGATTFGDLAGPIAIGLITDALGFSYMFAIAAGGFFLIALYFFRYPIER